ncbi:MULTISPECIES: nucleotidyltransferase family protein [Bacillus cereus group]|uniref:hypothetical protein n=1 Tax=Bacillus cereus group TaxID=86661 RepID=UPI000993F4D2|nr:MULTISPECIES: hypothetical protein [Bacillus cereus group]OOR20907.1 hypothetical protein BW891_03200 [Bacillus mycoides]QWG80462.1 hypothetical protein EXW27_23850 [Bacillus mycoides]TXR88552.1 hypothetical protein DN408_07420 [Bacillus sp. AR13-1]
MDILQIQGLQDLQEIKPYCHYSDIQKLFLEIYDLHNKFSAAWIKKNQTTGFEFMNLNKRQVRNVSSVIEDREVFLIDNMFYRLIKSYMNELESLTVESELEYDYTELDLRTRIKQNESVVNKLKYYRVGKEGAGAFNLNKCLNDLFGIRIIIEDFDHNCRYFNDLCEGLKAEYRIRTMDSSKNNYKATHIYFYGESNRYFPWELQVWNANDLSSNVISHSLHKQEYTKWADIYKNSAEIEGGA